MCGIQVLLAVAPHTPILADQLVTHLSEALSRCAAPGVIWVIKCGQPKRSLLFYLSTQTHTTVFWGLLPTCSLLL